MQQQETEDGGQKRTPPYIAFQSLKTLAGDFKQHGVPGRVDRSVLTKFSGGVGSQVMSALRFLDLMDSGSVPTDWLRQLVSAYGGPDWPATVEQMLRSAYPPMFAIDLETASPGMFMEAFRRAYPAKDETFRKCITFFLNAAKDAEIPISPYILKGSKPRRALPKTKRKITTIADLPKGKQEQEPVLDLAAAKAEIERQDEERRRQAASTQTPAQMLLEILDPDAMDDEEQKAVFTLLLFLKKPTKETAPGK